MGWIVGLEASLALRHTAEEIAYEDMHMHAGSGACKVAALVQLRDRRRDARLGGMKPLFPR